MSASQGPQAKKRLGWRAGLMGGFMQFLTGLLWGIAVPVYVIVYRLATPEGVEHDYTRGFYRLIAEKVIPYTEQFPFSISLILTAWLVLGLPVMWIAQCIDFLRKGEGLLAGLIWGPLRLIFLAPLLFVWFAVFWGTGYQRPPVEARMEFDTEKPSTDEIKKLQDGLYEIIVRDMPKTAADRDVERAVRAISDSMAALVEETENRSARLPRRVKATPPGWLLFNSTSGICSPFTLEANVDGAIPDTGFVYVAAHELAHTAGINREGEATLYGQIAALRSDDAYARYCVALDAYSDLTRDLDGEDRKAAVERLPQESRNELKHIHEVSRSYNVEWFSGASWKVYNKYLQAQGIKEGTKNYSASTKLFVFAARKGLIKLDTAPAAPPA